MKQIKIVHSSMILLQCRLMQKIFHGRTQLYAFHCTLSDSFYNPALHTHAQRRAYILHSSFVMFIALAFYIRLNR